MQNYNISHLEIRRLWSSFNLMTPYNISTSVLPCFFEHPILPEPNDVHHLNFRGWGSIAGIIIEKHGLQTLGLCARNVGKPVPSVECIWSRRVSLQRWWTWVFETAWVGSSLFGLTKLPQTPESFSSPFNFIWRKGARRIPLYASAQHEFLNPKWQKHQSFTTTWNQKTTRWKTYDASFGLGWSLDWIAAWYLRWDRVIYWAEHVCMGWM